MTDQNSNDAITFDLPKNQSSVIKVIGIGGGGSNAVNHMYSMEIKGVDFVICNTDAQALNSSPIPNKIQLGVTLTEGLGAGSNPEIGQQAALESIEEIKSLMQNNTKMAFITAGMGGGTGSGAAPVIAKAARDMSILTVGIVTIPFLFEGNNRKKQAEKGIDALRQNVDSLIVINNNKLREVYGNLGFKAGFAKADEVLSIAAKGITEVITHHYTTNIDLRDAKTVLTNSGTAIMGSATASGENRAAEAITKALDSPLLNDSHIRGAKNVLLLIVSGKEEITIDEIGEINDYIQAESRGDANIIMGIGEDAHLENDIAITIVATGFPIDQQVKAIGCEPQKIVHTLGDEQAVSASVYNKHLEQEEENNIISKELNRVKQGKEEEALNKTAKPEIEESKAPIMERRDNKPLFEIFSEELQEKAEPEMSQTQNKDEDIPSSFGEESAEEKYQSNRTIYTLEDYQKLEEQLNKASPTVKKDEVEKVQKEAEDESLRFELKQVPENQQKRKDSDRPKKVPPLNSSIEEIMRLKAKEKKSQLKAFNYRFKAHPFSVNEAESETAYKRRRLKIDKIPRSDESKISRFTIDNEKDGNTIKTN